MKFTARPSEHRDSPVASLGWIALSVWDRLAMRARAPEAISIAYLGFVPNALTSPDVLIVVELRGWRSWFPCTRYALASKLNTWLRIHRLPRRLTAHVVVLRGRR